MNQTDFSEVVGCSVVTIQAVERGPDRLKLSDALATKIHHATAVSFEWLKKNDLNTPPVTADGQLYTLAFFEGWQARKLHHKNTAHFYTDIPGVLFDVYATMRQTMMTATERGQKHMALYRLSRFLEDFKEEFTGERIPYVPQYDNRTVNLISSDLTFVMHLMRKTMSRPFVETELGPYFNRGDKSEAQFAAPYYVIKSEMKLLLEAVDFHIALKAINRGTAPEYCAVHLLDIMLVQMGMAYFPAIEQRGADFYYRNVRLVEHHAIRNVRRGLPVADENSNDDGGRFLNVFIPLYKHWQAFEKQKGRKPTYTYINPESLKALVSGSMLPHLDGSPLLFIEKPFIRANLDSPLHNNDGETVIYYNDASCPVAMRLDPKLGERKFRSV